MPSKRLLQLPLGSILKVAKLLLMPWPGIPTCEFPVGEIYIHKEDTPINFRDFCLPFKAYFI